MQMQMLQLSLDDNMPLHIFYIWGDFVKSKASYYLHFKTKTKCQPFKR